MFHAIMFASVILVCCFHLSFNFHFSQRSESIKSMKSSVKHKKPLPHSVLVIFLEDNLKFIFNDSGDPKVKRSVEQERAQSKAALHRVTGAYSSSLSGDKKNTLCCFLNRRFPILEAISRIRS